MHVLRRTLQSIPAVSRALICAQRQGDHLGPGKKHLGRSEKTSRHSHRLLPPARLETLLVYEAAGQKARDPELTAALAPPRNPKRPQRILNN